MKPEHTLKELESVAEKKLIRVSYENIGGELGAGGLCKVKGEWRVIVDKRASDGDKVTVLSTALARFPLDDIYISEETRGLIDRSRPKVPTVAERGVEQVPTSAASEPSSESTDLKI